MSAARKIKLSVFMMMDGNYHLAGWRLPGAHADGGQEQGTRFHCSRFPRPS